jgi:parallel beta-helix repeat protein
LSRIKAGLVSGVWVLALFVALLGVVLKVPVVRASGTIYIRADGSIEGTTYIHSDDNVTYVFIADINDSIVVERSNITIDGNGYAVQGSGSGYGFYLSNMNNVTIKNTNINAFYCGIFLNYSSNNNSLIGNSMTNNWYSVLIVNYSSYNSIIGNSIMNNAEGIFLEWSSNNNISRNNITNSRGWCGFGVGFEGSSNNTVAENTMTNNIYGVALGRSSYNSISGNNVTANDKGIRLYAAPYNNLSGNSVATNEIGVIVYGSRYNIFRNNSMIGNSVNFDIDDEPIYDRYYSYIQDIDASNTLDNKPMYYWINRQNMQVPSDAGFVALIDSYNITVGGLELRNNTYGLLLLNTNSSEIKNNTITNNTCGAIVFGSSGNNRFYRNDFIDNIFWGTSAQMIIQSGYRNFLDGNYWSDYNGTDSNGDGIGDTPYIIKYLSDIYGRDCYPLIAPYGVDSTHPLIGVPSREPSSDVQPDQSVKVLVNITDIISGVKNATLSYTIDNGSIWIDLFMNLNSSNNLYEVTIPAQQAGKTVRFKIVAYDYAGNNATLDGTQPYCVYQVVPEFSSFLILPLFMMATLPVVIAYRRKRSKSFRE